MKYFFILILSIIVLQACTEDEPELASYEERVTQAIEHLEDELTSPVNGWVLNYRPTNSSGVYFMLLNFNEDGSVRVQTDLSANEGEFYDQTITYRIDNALNLELIFDTYGAFHYLFELDQALFGAEFEFLYEGKDGDNLFFTSKSDINSPSTITLVPAGPGEASKLSYELAENINQFGGYIPDINYGAGVPSLGQRLYIVNENISIFWELDIPRRTINATRAGQGATIEEVFSSNPVDLNHFVGFTYQNGEIVLDEPISFTYSGSEYSISSISLVQLSPGGHEFCEGSGNVTPFYSGSIDGLGSIQLFQSPYNRNGEAFEVQEFVPYSINALFLFNAENESLLEDGSLATLFPDASGFILSYGYDNPDSEILPYSVGFTTEDEDGNSAIYMRNFEPTATIGNKATINLLDEYNFDTDSLPDVRIRLDQITDELFEGNEVFAYYGTIQGLEIITLYNPCNDYELLVVK